MCVCVCDTLPPPPCINEEMRHLVPSVRKRQGGSPVKEVEEGVCNMVWHFSGLLFLMALRSRWDYPAGTLCHGR